MDPMESELLVAPVIILQTVMEEVRHRSLPLFNRLKALTKTDGKTTWIFYNEFSSWVSARHMSRCLSHVIDCVWIWNGQGHRRD